MSDMSEPGFDPAHDLRPLVRRIGKPPEQWRRRDLATVCLEDGIRMVDFRYPSFDGKLRELRVPVASAAQLDRVLAAGERVDGSSLFPGVFESRASDLYVVPVYRWAFLDPWASDELHVVCRFAGRDGAPAPTPDNLLARAAQALAAASGLDLAALAELEYYLILERDDERFTGRSQRNYHQSAPYLHGRAIADEILRTTAALTGCVKYGHAEVGYIDRLESGDPELDGRRVEQHEVELDLVPIEDLGCWLSVLRWLVRTIADRHGASATFVPKLDEGMAGSGMHLHLALMRQGRNVMLGADGELSLEARRLVGGLLRHAAPLAAFGNTVAGSYLRLVPNQEAPTRLTWGRADRSALLQTLARVGIEVKAPRSFQRDIDRLKDLTASTLKGLEEYSRIEVGGHSIIIRRPVAREFEAGAAGGQAPQARNERGQEGGAEGPPSHGSEAPARGRLASI
ncbi:MAG: hypothetical protein F9K18_10995, partial [Thermoanaerobaculia bacterium]